MSARNQYIVRVYYSEFFTEDVYVNANNKKEAFYLASVNASRPEMIKDMVIVREIKIGGEPN